MLITLHTWDKNKPRYVNPRYIVEVYDYDEGGSMVTIAMGSLRNTWRAMETAQAVHDQCWEVARHAG